MLIVLTNFDHIKNYWQSEFSRNYGVKITQDMQWFKNTTVKDNDIFILDLDMFGNVEEIVAYLEQLPKNLKTIGLLQEPRLAHGTYLIKHGFKSYLGKETAKIIISQALRTVEQGNVWIYPELMSYIIKSIADTADKKINNHVLEQLSPKEQEVTKLVANGYSNKDIAEKMGIQIVTVKKHLVSIFDKLHVKDRVSLAIMVNKG